MFTKLKANKVYKYLKKRMFTLELIDPKIRELLMDDNILEELNKKLLPEQKLYKTKNLVVAKISIISENKRNYIKYGIEATIISKFFKYGILEKVSDEELRKLKYKEYHTVNAYNWISKKHKIIQYNNNYVDYLKGDFFLRYNVIPFSFYKECDFITLEQINELEKKLNNDNIKSSTLKNFGF